MTLSVVYVLWLLKGILPRIDCLVLCTMIMNLLCNKMWKENITAESIADLLICASRHDAKEMREVALDNIRTDRGICKEEGFKKKMKNIDSSILIDLLNDL